MRIAMNKIIVLGPSGAGKSVFSRKLNKITNIPVFHLDNIWWKSDKSHIEREEFDNKLANILSKDKWIIDGDYSRTYEIRFQNADTVFFLDYPLDVCFNGAEERIGKKREDLPWVEEEFDKEFQEWIINWFMDVRPIVYSMIDKYMNNKNIYIFKSRNDAANFISNL